MYITAVISTGVWGEEAVCLLLHVPDSSHRSSRYLLEVLVQIIALCLLSSPLCSSREYQSPLPLGQHSSDHLPGQMESAVTQQPEGMSQPQAHLKSLQLLMVLPSGQSSENNHTGLEGCRGREWWSLLRTCPGKKLFILHVVEPK
jgi:hypothetical protein